MAYLTKLAFSLIIAGGCIIVSPKGATAQTTIVVGIEIDWSGCGNGSMCTNDKYICTE